MIALKTVTLTFDLGGFTAVKHALEQQKISIDRTLEQIAVQMATQFAAAEQEVAKAARVAKRAARAKKNGNAEAATPPAVQ